MAARGAVPFAWLVFTAHDRWAYTTAMAIAETLIFVSTGPVNSAIVNVVAPERRATAVALSILAIHLLGDVPSPPLIGFVSDHLEVLFDIDLEARAIAEEIGLHLVRTASLNDDPVFTSILANVIRQAAA